ncbi:tyrosine-type recombinase/integrase [Alkalihalophilus lindianensis]|uniref:Tyrosine-type recombinase/integrase n=1 Tax=Alkalihalophilus lindianensis TaxID=1630542 RepID=A0ABU3XDZ5_9BACI|nr:tyrosine-type recombinase/integrase [Alkalihalophilus lindianensis]MDV2686053.1 tyrosine-type recombinase/integrase [Alkalihalophilus lindianensis]
MEYVEPIKEIELIKRIKTVLKEKSKRDYVLFVFGINTGILISHLLQIKVKDVYDGQSIKDYYLLQEAKNVEEKLFYINQKVKEALLSYIKEARLQQEDFLFKSRKNDQPITRQQAYRIINTVAREVGMREKIGTHTLRKTFGYHAYCGGVAIYLLQAIFNHSTKAETLRYIGIDKKNVKVKIDVNL